MLSTKVTAQYFTNGTRSLKPPVCPLWQREGLLCGVAATLTKMDPPEATCIVADFKFPKHKTRDCGEKKGNI